MPNLPTLTARLGRAPAAGGLPVADAPVTPGAQVAAAPARAPGHAATEESGHRSGDVPLRWRAVRAAGVSAPMRAAWSALEGRALEANAYLSPHFVLPALRHLDPGAPVDLVFVEEAGTGQLRGLGVFRERPAARGLPWPHREAYRSLHSFLSGLLVDRDHAPAAVAALFDYLCGGGRHRHALLLHGIRAEGPLADLIRHEATRRDALVMRLGGQGRAVLVPARAGEPYLRQRIPKRFKSIERHRQRLAERGKVRWRLHRGHEVDPAVIERHLSIEHDGWKGDQGSSLRSSPAGEAFFREMVGGFAAEGRALFTELSVDDQVIASTSNVVSGEAGFAFKIGYARAFARYSPGLINEIELIRHAPDRLADLEGLDSGAAEGSFIEQLWLERVRLESLGVAFSTRARLALRLGAGLRRLRAGLRALLAGAVRPRAGA